MFLPLNPSLRATSNQDPLARERTLLLAYHAALAGLEDADLVHRAHAEAVDRRPSGHSGSARGLRPLESRLWAIDARTGLARAVKGRSAAREHVEVAHQRWLDAQPASDAWARRRPWLLADRDGLRREALMPYPAKLFAHMGDLTVAGNWQLAPGDDGADRAVWTLEEPAKPWQVGRWRAVWLERERSPRRAVAALEVGVGARPRVWWLGTLADVAGTPSGILACPPAMATERNTLVWLAQAIHSGAHLSIR